MGWEIECNDSVAFVEEDGRMLSEFSAQIVDTVTVQQVGVCQQSQVSDDLALALIADARLDSTCSFFACHT